ncbi:MAG: succinate--CoA ligase subunit alpha [Halobacteria archaeon]
MSVLVDDDTRLVVQGITGSEGKFHAEQMIEYGTNVVAGVTPGKGGDEVLDVPVFNTVEEAVEETDANASAIFVPPAFSGDAVMESINSDLDLAVAITEGIPSHDMIEVTRRLNEVDTHLVGPNCPGVISPGEAKIGIMPGNIFSKGNVGLVSRSGTLTYQLVDSLTRRDVGQSSVIGIGGDPIIGTSFIDALELFENDDETDAIALVGEIGGSDEEEAAEYIEENVSKPVVGFIAGQTAPPGKRMGHAGAIVSGSSGTAESKVKALSDAGVPVPDTPSGVAEEIADLV